MNNKSKAVKRLTMLAVALLALMALLAPPSIQARFLAAPSGASESAILEAPLAATPAADSFDATEDILLTVLAPGVLTNDTPSAPVTAITVTIPPTHALTFTGPATDGSFTYQAEANYNSTDQFTYTVSDAAGTSVGATVTINIAAVNDPPVNTVAPTVSGTHTVGQLLTAANGTWNDDKDGNPAPSAFAYQWQRANDSGGTGSADIPSATSQTYTLVSADAHKYVRVVVTATDAGTPDTASATANSAWIAVANSAPAIGNTKPAAVTMSEDNSPSPFSLTLNATDVDADTLTWTVSSPASHGIATASGTGTSKPIGYTPILDYVGSDSFAIQVSDGLGGSDNITVNITINPVNDPPVNTVAPTVSGTHTVGQVLTAANGTWNDDKDGNPAPSAFAYQWQRANDSGGTGSADIPSATSQTYTLVSADAHKYVRVVVTATDAGTPDTASATANSAWLAVANTPPIISESSPVPVTMSEDGVPTAFSLTLHAGDVDGDTLTWSISSIAAHGTASATSTGPSKAIGYTPKPDYNGSDSFVVQVADGNSGTATVTVNVTIDPVNDAPVNTAIPTVSGTLAVGQTLTAANGTWNDTKDGNPAPSAFAYQWQKGNSASDPSPSDIGGATSQTYVVANGDAHKFLRVKVTATDSGTPAPGLPTIAYSDYAQLQNTPPTGGDDTVTTNEDTPKTFASTDFTFADADLDSFNGIEVQTLPGAGSLAAGGGPVVAPQLVADVTTLVFTPATDGNGSPYATFTFKVRDNNATPALSTATYTMTVNVTPVNDAPVNTAIPTVSGTLAVGQTLTAANGTWNDTKDGNPAPSAFAYQWQKGNSASDPSPSDIGGATSQTYVVANGDAHKFLRVKVTATDSGTPAPGLPTIAYSDYAQLQNTPPTGGDDTVTTNEDTPKTFASTDFTFADADLDSFNGIEVQTLPGAGSLAAGGGPVVAPQLVADVTTLVFTPATDGNGSPYATFTFKVRDNNATPALSTATYTMTVNVTPVNDAPVNTAIPTVSGTLAVGQTLTAANGTWNDTKDGNPAPSAFAYQWQKGNSASDPSPSDIGGATSQTYVVANGDAHKFLRVKVTATDSGTPAPGLPTIAYSDYAQLQNTPPTGGDDTVTTNEDTPKTFASTDFTFADADLDSFNGIEVQTLPGVGTLRDGATDITTVPYLVSSVATLSFVPVGNANGTAYATFTFKVRDDNTPTPALSTATYTMTVDVTAVNDAPTITAPAGPLTVLEDTDLVFDGGITAPMPAPTHAGVISTSDIDSALAPAGLELVKLTVTHGELTIGTVPAGVTFPDAAHLNGTAAPWLQGTIVDLNSALATLKYHGDLNWNDNQGTESLVIDVDDQGSTGLGTALTATQTVNISVTPLNDPPSFTLYGVSVTIQIGSGLVTVPNWALLGSPGPSDETSQTMAFVTGGYASSGFDPIYPPAVSADGTLTFKPSADTTWEGNVTLAVRDSGGTAYGGADTTTTDVGGKTAFHINVYRPESGGGGGGGGTPVIVASPVPVVAPPVAPPAPAQESRSEAPAPTATPVPLPTPAPTAVPFFVGEKAASIAVASSSSSLPSGLPLLTDAASVGVLKDGVSGFAVMGTRWNGADSEVWVDPQGKPVVVAFQPLSENPPANLPTGMEAMRSFGLHVLNYDPDSNTASEMTPEDIEAASDAVIVIGLTGDEFNRLVKDAYGDPDPNYFYLVRVLEDGTTEAPITNIGYLRDPAPYGSIAAIFRPRSTFMVVITPRPESATGSRYFMETGYRVGRDAFFDYFQKRGGIRTFGYPISREFTLMGFTVQMFQRGMLQLNPDGSVSSMNLLDSGLMPYNQMNFSTFPAASQSMVDTAPQPDDPEYAEKALEFVRANVPDQWEGNKVKFLDLFLNTVQYQDAFPRNDGEPALVPLMNLEMWGLPTSKPAYDPNNGNFIYQRFQRGIMHYDAASGATQGLLLADYLKSIITGKNLPIDLASDATTSKYYRQYDPIQANSVARPGDIPNSNLSQAFEKDTPDSATASAQAINGLLVLLPIVAMAGLLVRPRRRRE